MEITVEKIDLNQLPALQEISKQTFLDTFYSDGDRENMNTYLNTAFSYETLKNELLNPNSFFYMAYSQKTVLGYLKVNVSSAQTEELGEDHLEIQRIYVDRPYHGKKVGDKLIQQALELAKELGKKHIWLGVWEENNRAVNFYKKYGFEPFGTHSFEYGSRIDTDVLMRKTLKY